MTHTGEIPSLEQQIIQFFTSEDININSHDISACHPRPRKDNKSKPAIIIRFANSKGKNDVLRQTKKLRGMEVYVKEHLTKKNTDIARQVRALRKQKKVSNLNKEL